MMATGSRAQSRSGPGGPPEGRSPAASASRTLKGGQCRRAGGSLRAYEVAPLGLAFQALEGAGSRAARRGGGPGPGHGATHPSGWFASFAQQDGDAGLVAIGAPFIFFFSRYVEASFSRGRRGEAARFPPTRPRLGESDELAVARVRRYLDVVLARDEGREEPAAEVVS